MFLRRFPSSRFLPQILPLALLAIASAASAFATDTPSPAFTTAVQLFDARRLPEARDAFTAVVAREPTNPEALWYLARAQAKLQHRDEALVFFARALELAPRDPRILADYGITSALRAGELGINFRALGLARKGREAMEKAVALSPDNIAYRENLVEFYRNAPGIAGGDMAKAYAQAEAIAQRDPRRGLLLRASIQAYDKRYDEALATCTEILRTAPDTYTALYTLGRIASESGRELDLGETSLRRCLELTPADNEPNHAGARYRLGLIAEKRKRPDLARAEYQAALTLEPTFTRAAEALARLK
jgi:tetratricopeptide (TPR) repeat protein